MGVDNVEAVTFGHELVVGVGTAIVRVTLWTVGKTLTIARVWGPELAREVAVKDVVSGITAWLFACPRFVGNLTCAAPR